MPPLCLVGRLGGRDGAAFGYVDIAGARPGAAVFDFVSSTEGRALFELGRGRSPPGLVRLGMGHQRGQQGHIAVLHLCGTLGRPLRVTYYARSGNNWVQEWVIRYFVDCPGLDHEAEFFPDSVTVTDLNANGKAEVTVAYSLFCGGGIDPSTLKVIMREGPLKFAMRGTTIIQTPGNAPFGGEANYDQSLDKAENSAFKKHIMAVREKVVIKNYE